MSEINFSKIGRNDPCPCGSDKKAKKCCWDDFNRLVQIDPSTIRRKWKEGDLEQLMEDLDRDTYNREYVQNCTSLKDI